jgi:rhomboid family protein
MLEDRSYMRGSEFRTRGMIPVTIALLLVNLAVFVILEVHKGYQLRGLVTIYQYFALSNEGLSHGYLWQLLTYQFLHATGWHFVWNMLMLFLFGRSVEESIGRKHFLWLYFGSGVAGGLLQSLLGLLSPAVFGVPVVGASAGIFGLVAAFATLDPNREILLFFILPIRARYIFWMAFVVALFYIVVPAEQHVAHGAHLGGLIAGWAYVRWIIQSPFSLRWRWRPLRPRRLRQELVETRSSKRAPWSRGRSVGAAELPPEEFISREVDPILDKISANGIQSLTPRERQILEAARAKMEKR